MSLFGENRNGAFHLKTKISCVPKGCLVGKIIVYKHFFFFFNYERYYCTTIHRYCNIIVNVFCNLFNEKYAYEKNVYLTTTICL